MIIQVCSTHPSHYLQMTFGFFPKPHPFSMDNTITQTVFKGGSISDSSYCTVYCLAYGMDQQTNEEIPQEFINLFNAENIS